MARWAFNPLTNELDRIGDDGGGGGGDVTIRGEDGSSITGDDFTFSGQKYGASETAISEVDTSTGEVITNVHAWETPYVVDSSTIEGEKGTYATIQAAIDAAVTDGAALNSPKVIVLRAGVYQEDLNIPPGIFLRGQNLIASSSPTVREIVAIHGNHTLQNLNLFRAQGISFRNITLDTPIFSLAVGATTVFFNFINCWINNENCTVKAITIGFQFNRFESCTFHGIAYSTIMEVLPGAAVQLASCVFTGAQKVLNSGSFRVVDSTLGEIILSGGSTIASGCTFQSNASCFSGSSAGIAANSCVFACANSAVNVTSIAASGVVLNACSISEGTANLYEFGSTLYTKTSISGNVHPHVLVEGNTSMKSTQQVVYCNTENDPCNLTLPQNPSLDRVWTIKDSFGNASNNPITLSSISSQTVDKQASYVIDSNFGCVTLQATETGDFVVLSETKTSGGGSTPSIKITKFFAPGTWTPDPLAKMSRHLIWGGAGGGGSGASGASGLAGGGGGGAPGCFLDAIIDHSMLLDSTYSVTIGSGGEGGEPVSGTEVNGNPGTNGGASSVGDSSITGLGVAGGNAGQAGGTSGGGGGGGGGSQFILAGIRSGALTGGNGSNTGGTVGTSSPYIAATGGGGGVGYNNGTPRQGPRGGSISGSGILYLAQGGVGGDSSGGNAGDGNSYTGPLLSIGGSGGGAGGHDGVTTAGSGGNGATPGGGGGGGAGNLSGNPSGAGGNGGDGRVIIIEYF